MLASLFYVYPCSSIPTFSSFVPLRSPNRDFPTPATLLSCSAGTYNPAYASATCLACSRGSYQPTVGQNECIACRLGFTTREMGSLNVSACVPVIPDDFAYPPEMSCEEVRCCS